VSVRERSPPGGHRGSPVFKGLLLYIITGVKGSMFCYIRKEIGLNKCETGSNR
jgi:hypothetical protein